jgi:hypothetical protein
VIQPIYILIADKTSRTMNQNGLELRGTAGKGRKRPEFHPGAPRSLSPQQQMPIFFTFGLTWDSEDTFIVYFRSITSITVAAWARGDGGDGGRGGRDVH